MLFFNNADYLVRVACRPWREVHKPWRAPVIGGSATRDAGLASMEKAAAWYAADRGSIPLTGTNHVEVSKWSKEPGRKPGGLRPSRVRIHAFYTNDALVAQLVERLSENQEVGVSKPPQCTNPFRFSSMVEPPPVKRRDAGSSPAAGANHGGVSEKADALQAAAGRFDSGHLHHAPLA